MTKLDTRFASILNLMGHKQYLRFKQRNSPKSIAFTGYSSDIIERRTVTQDNENHNLHFNFYL
ncbi:hypothetical protein VCRA2113O324_10499 [Vibrio crassostreae]|nr:hypothetical protein VCRA2113O324_10499 [Vibrio crassostreae]CAK2030435.1 hypothetical protein VCRA2111O320_20499 [Vibrio crassostreae]CAK2765222.1 hypothetical protein VCRA2121O336_10501 [Vibrio crassostreae]CAK3355480.1 hypothetical protein VCRA217O315_10500 [Vibrio crassostreae]CAK3398990.1 hypothetical protein VCRA217O316_20055 [Vibrio crassostreae]